MAKRAREREVNWGDGGEAGRHQLPPWTEQQRAYVFKEIPELTFGDPRGVDEVAIADRSLYGLWYRFLRANADEYPPPTATPADDPRAILCDHFCDLGSGFREWWLGRGRDLFREQGSLPFVRVLARRRAAMNTGNDAIDQMDGEVIHPPPSRAEISLRKGLRDARRADAGDAPVTSLIVEIPMTISRELINHQLKALFEAYHPGEELRRHRFSTAALTIFPRRRYDQPLYEKLLAVWVFKQRHPDETWWQIGARAEVDPLLVPGRATAAMDEAANREELGRKTFKLHAQAERMMWHALRGRFPCDDEIDAGAV